MTAAEEIIYIDPKWSAEFPQEVLDQLPSYFSLELYQKYGIRVGTTNAACAAGIFPAAKIGSNWKIYKTPYLEAWILGHKGRQGRGQGPKKKEQD